MKEKWYRHSVLAPVFIGAILIMVSVVLEIEPLGWVGAGVHLFGWFVALRDG